MSLTGLTDSINLSASSLAKETFLFNSKITSSPVINGNSLFFGDDSGYLYSLNIEKYEVPGSVQLYYSIAVLIIVIVVAIVIIKKIKK